MLSARFCWGLAGAVLLLNLTSTAIIAADGDLFLLPLVPSAPVAALMGGWWRPAVPVTRWACCWSATRSPARWPC